MYNLEYNHDEQTLYVVNDNKVKKVLDDGFPSEPKVSPNGKKAIYISPLEWECLGSLYLFDLITGEQKELIEPDEKSYIPKEAIWLNDKQLAVIIGYGYGTVAIGGNIFVYDIESKELRSITKFEGMKKQVTEIQLKGDLLTYKGIEYIDEAMSEFKAFEDETAISLFI